MNDLRFQAEKFVKDFLLAQGVFEDEASQGMSASTYPRVFATQLLKLDKPLQAEAIGVLLEYAMGTRGEPNEGAFAAITCSNLALRGLGDVFGPQKTRIQTWIDDEIRRLSVANENSESIQKSMRSVSALVAVLWCIDDSLASKMTDRLIEDSSNQAIRNLLRKNKNLLRLRKAALED